MTPIERALAARRHSPEVADRIRQLNPSWRPNGQIPRGWHPKQTVGRIRLYYNLVSKGEFIRGHGRDAWNSMPRYSRRRFGRKQFVTRAAVDDRLWMTT